MFGHNSLPVKHWRRHIAAIPKGLLRYYVLKLLSVKPMSGAEMSEEIEKRTFGSWRPSPGSIYPLLAWLQANEFIEGVPTEETGIKLYKLTEKGRNLLEKHRKIKDEMKRKLKVLAPPVLFDLMWFDLYRHGNSEAFRNSTRRFLTSLFEVMENLEVKFSKEALDELKRILEEASRKIEEVNKKIKKEEGAGPD